MAIAQAGYRVKGLGHHMTTFQSLSLAMPEKETLDDSRYFDSCRRLRNELSYESSGVVNERDVNELLVRVRAFQKRVESSIA